MESFGLGPVSYTNIGSRAIDMAQSWQRSLQNFAADVRLVIFRPFGQGV